MKHIGSKLFIGFLCMAILTVGILWLIQAGIMKDSYLTERVNAVDSALKQVAGENDVNFSDLEERLNVHFILLDRNGSISYISQSLPMRGMILQKGLFMITPDANGKVQTISSMTSDMQYALIGRTMQYGGTLYAIFSLADVQEASRIILKQLWIITAALLLLSILCALVLSRMFSRPIHHITHAARSIAGGNLNIVLPVKSKDEIGQLTEALNELTAQLKITDNLRKELIANVSHELRSPLSIIRGYAETVRDVTWPHAEKRTEQLSMIANEAARLSRIVNDILDYSRLQAGAGRISVSEFNVYPVLNELLKKYELDSRSKNVTIVLNSPDVIIRFDPDKFEQVLGNLLNNAINHAKEGSSIDMTVELSNGNTRITVTNTGKTIPQDELIHIWDRYYQTEQIGEKKQLGTGLGLAIVKTILEKHGVEFGVISKNSKTSFWFDTQPIS